MFYFLCMIKFFVDSITQNSHICACIDHKLHRMSCYESCHLKHSTTNVYFLFSSWDFCISGRSSPEWANRFSIPDCPSLFSLLSLGFRGNSFFHSFPLVSRWLHQDSLVLQVNVAWRYLSALTIIFR